MMTYDFKCPKCSAEPHKHGKGNCINDSRTIDCEGLICDCDLEECPLSDQAGHGETFENPCTEANCYHCGWGGTVPVTPKGLQAWEKKALAAGWTMPESRAKELSK
jgi:hypothetical protein